MADLTDLADRIASEPVAPTPPRRLLDRELERRRRRRVPTGVVALFVVACLALGGFVLSRTSGSSPSGIASTDSNVAVESSGGGPGTGPESVAPAPDASTFAGVAACRNLIDDLAARREAGFPQPFDPDAAEEIVVLPLPASPAAVWVLLIGDGGSYGCRVLRSATADDVAMSLSVSTDQPGSPETGAISPLHGRWTAAPPTVEVVGRVGAAVTDVALHLPDGTRLPGFLTDGWFVVDGDIAIDVPPSGETIEWILTDGQVRSTALDRLLHDGRGSRQVDPPADPPRSTSETWLAGREAFPVLDSPDELGASVYATAATSGDRVGAPGSPKVTSMVVGRRRGDLLVDVATIRVLDPAPDSGDLPAAVDRTASELGGRIVETYEADGERSYRWRVGGMVVGLDDTPDADALAAAIDVHGGDDGGWPELQVQNLPDGLEVLDGPTTSADGPAPGLSTDHGSAPGLDVFVWPGLGIPGGTAPIEVVAVGDAEAYLVDVDGALLLAWQIQPGTWAHLDGRGMDRDRLLRIAATMRFVDRATWEAIYGIDLDRFSVPPTTTTTPVDPPTG